MKTLIAVAVVAGLVACDGEQEDLNAPRVDRALVEHARTVKRLEAMFTIPAKMAAIEPVAKRFGPLEGKARVYAMEGGPPRNVMYVHLAELEAGRYVGTEPSLAEVLDWQSPWLALQATRRAKQAGKPYGSVGTGLAYDLGKLAVLEYVVVVRGTYMAASIASSSTFVPGSFIGDAQMFALGETAEHVGGVVLAATNGDRVEAHAAEGRINEALRDRLKRDLEKRLEVELAQQLAAYGGVEIAPWQTAEHVKRFGIEL